MSEPKREKRAPGTGGYQTKMGPDGEVIAWRGAKMVGGNRRYTRWLPSRLAAEFAMDRLTAAPPKILAPVVHTLAEAVEQFMISYNVSAGTRADYTYALNHYLAELAATPIDEITGEQISLRYQELAHEGYALSTIKRARAVIYGGYKYALQFKWCDAHVAKGIPLPTGFVDEREAVEGFDDDERAKLFAAMEGTRYEVRHRLALEMGLRPGEATALRWSRVLADTIRIDGQLQRLRIDGGDGEVGTIWKGFTKSGAGVRTLKPGSKTMRLLFELRDQQAAERAAFPVTAKQLETRKAAAKRLAHAKAGRKIARAAQYELPPDDLCFTLPTGGPILAAWDTVLWRQLCVKAGVPHRSLYSARHSAISSLLRRGADPLAVSVLAGHRDLAFTARVYGDDLSQRSHDLTSFFDVPDSEFV